MLKLIVLENFLCHDHLKVEFNKKINFIIGKNGSGKSAILTGIVVALGERASSTCRGQSLKGKLISKKHSDLDRILAQMNIQVDNPVCILNQETAKNFLHNNDAQQKYKLFERATQIDAIHNEYLVAKEEISKSKSCLEEKLQSLKFLHADVNKWKTKKEWYDEINKVHDKKEQLQNEILWAHVEGFEKKATKALQKKKNQLSEIEKVQVAREKFAVVDKQLTEMKNRKKTFQNDLGQLGTEKQRLMKDKTDLIKEIENLKKTYGDSEHAQEKARREISLYQLKEKFESFDSSRKVSEHQVEQLNNACIQLRNETVDVKSESRRIHVSLETKKKTLAQLQKSDSNSCAVFGEWVPKLLQRIERTPFRGSKPKGPIGSYIKLRDRSWAPVIEHFFGPRLSCFVCSNDEDAKLLQKLVHEEVPRNGQTPKILVSCMNGQVHDVREHKVHCSEELLSKDIHCLMDMLIIDDNDVTNVLIDLNGIEQVLLIGKDRDACYLLADSSRVPYNCKSAITKEGNTYHPDPNYRSYCGRVRNTARYLQASVEDAIRNLQQDIENLQRDEIRIGQLFKNLSMQIQNNEGQLKHEESKLSSTQKEIIDIVMKKRTIEEENVEGNSTDVLALEEDLVDVEKKLERIDEAFQTKSDNFEELKRELEKLQQTADQHQTTISSLMTNRGPLQESFRLNEIQQQNIKEKIDKLSTKLTSMQSNFDAFEADYEDARAKAESEAALSAQASSRVLVTKSLKNLYSELRQLEKEVVAQEKELGSRDHVYAEYRRRNADYERAYLEVTRVQSSLGKMMDMSKKRKEYISVFRDCIESRTFKIFRALLRTRHYSGKISFDHSKKTLSMIVVPPGRDESSQPAKRGRESGATDIRSLSGGERSFTTICFILSLWEATESPFRILDEFDVFMDHVNRSLCMELLVSEASEKSGRQFVFLTPLGVDNQHLNNMNDLFIFRMDDPDREENNPV
ncbi:putative SMC6, structural maintenance of chromosome protein 6, copy A [Daphnia pulex]|uniref:Putative SMC6, structural maintenance of chromosome protein 6, copy A n=1 Tax=Daphnia pulex TaxID=6669 RepID=E9GJ61_DAPPU|nr:putative SMC6, structural maintenance of chromosome protein 6, copy A [Daphnia pulex]|eukprot:EFX80391.1 putative SMC6, structural maintenance of chromosome protein 6, copy A [Daphnia pulex]